jgi:hypothetical protein
MTVAIAEASESDIAVATKPNRHDVQAAEYRALASKAQGSADATPLERVREKFESAAAVWTRLAEADEARALALRAAP